MRAALLILVVALAACQRAAETKETVRQAIIESVQGRVQLAMMDVDVTAVDFKGETAEAQVSFRAKGSTGAGIAMKYTLERKAGKWVVKNKTEGATPHGSAPPADGALPPGHPPVEPKR